MGPERKHGAEVRVELGPRAAVVHAAERGRDEEALRDRLERAGQVEVAVLEEVRDAEHELERQHALGRHAERHHGREPHRNREQQLAGMESQAGRHVEGRVGVLHPVETPRERHAMVRAVPRVGHRVERESAERRGDERVGAEPREEAEAAARGPGGRGPAAGYAHRRGRRGAEHPEAEVRAPRRPERRVRPPALERQPEHERRPQAQGPHQEMGGLARLEHAPRSRTGSRMPAAWVDPGASGGAPLPPRAGAPSAHPR